MVCGGERWGVGGEVGEVGGDDVGYYNTEYSHNNHMVIMIMIIIYFYCEYEIIIRPTPISLPCLSYSRWSLAALRHMDMGQRQTTLQ